MTCSLGSNLQKNKPLARAMVRIASTQAAFDAIASTLPLGSVGYENEANERGERYNGRRNRS
jgi:hypothetical protein